MVDVTLSLGGRRYSGWTGITIKRSLDSLVGEFALSLTDRERTGAERWPLRAGEECSVAIDGEQLISGFIDTLTPALSPDYHSISISGRDKAADLVDASAEHSPGSWRNVSIDTIAAELTAPFGITLDIAGDTGGKLKKFALQQGETVWSALERLFRHRGLLAWSLADGRVRVGNPGGSGTAARLVEGQNAFELEAEHDVRDRFSRYIVKGQASGDDEANGKTVAQVAAEATDPAVARPRPLIIIAEEQADKKALQARADWEANIRAARSQSARVTVPGWRDDDGALWSIERKVSIDAPSLYIAGEMLISEVAFVRDDNRGTVTDLMLARPEAYRPQPPVGSDSSALGEAA